MAAGTLLALAAAASFGVTTPFVARAARTTGPLTTAALLYAGAALSALVSLRLRRSRGAPLSRAHAGRLVLMAAFGAGIAPTALAFGLARTGALTGSLLLHLEAVLTALFAWLVHREHVGRRALVALGTMGLAGVVLTAGATSDPGGSVLGALAVVGATAAWAVDNTLSLRLAEVDPRRVVTAKGALGALVTASLAVALREDRPREASALLLFVCGATGYGASLALYLLAQRRIGAARTGSIFAVAPFVGAALAWALGDASPSPAAAVAAALFAVGLALHGTERHRHLHRHAALVHEHAHRHDDGHHEHAHDPPVSGEHTHPHRHEAIEHDHEHAPDVHHAHEHG